MRLHQLAGVDPSEIVKLFTNSELALLWAKNKHCQRDWEKLAEINNKYPKANGFSL